MAYHIKNAEKPSKQVARGTEQASNLEYEQWIINDGLLLAWFCGTMREDASNLIIREDTTFQIWNTLKE